MIKRFSCSSAHCLNTALMDDAKVVHPFLCDVCRTERANERTIPPDPLFGDGSLNKCGSLAPSPTALNVEDAPREQLKNINQQIWEADVRLEEDAIIKAGGAMTRNDLFLIAQQMCNESLLLMRKRNVEYAPENDPLANLRVFRMVSVCQEIHNCFSRLKRFAMADLKGEDKPMTDEQVRNAENDLLNFAILFRAMRIQCAGGKQ